MDYPSTPAPGAKTVTAHSGDQITYSVDATAPFAINAWNEATPNPENAPFWHQPHDLNGAEWADQKTAQDFADKWIEENFVNPPAPVTPPTSN
jgi:hypothetical protein